ncbi:MAG TPA: hypothetical protein VMU56_02260 [Beijerinckiaceae bacterium]|nr:hypothetical protein [Beijerinckiaceae bacterium]
MTGARLRNHGFVRVTTLPGWAVGLIAVGVALLAMLVLLLGLAFALLLAPIAIGALLVGRWRLRRLLRDVAQRESGGRGASGEPLVIDAEYSVTPENERR